MDHPTAVDRQNGLQIADSTADLLILGIAGGLPERPRCVVLEGDQGGYPAGAATAQVVLAGARQGDPDALPAMPFADGEPVHVAPPPVPAGDQGADDLTVALSHQKGGRRVLDQALDVIQAVGRRCVLAPGLGPKLQDRSRILAPTSTYFDSLVSQVGSIARLGEPEIPPRRRR